MTQEPHTDPPIDADTVDGQDTGSGGGLDADMVDGSHASELGAAHIEAKNGDDGTYKTSVSWTDAFGVTPIVTASCFNGAGTDTSYFACVESRSTTAATATTWDDTGTSVSMSKQFIAREPT